MKQFIELVTYEKHIEITISLSHIISVANSHYRSAVIVTEKGEYRVTDSYQDVLSKIRAINI